MKIVFMGTPDFAAGALEAIIQAGHEVVLVVTQPDKPQGRSKELKPSAVKECAMGHNLPIFQPEKIKRPEEIEKLKKYPADIFVVAAFGQILSKEILDMPPLGCINIHASLLPKYRGAAPIQWAVIDGEEKTGITIMKMDIGIDTGDILLQEEYTLAEDETGESLFDRLCVLGAELIVKALPLIEQGKLTPVKQKEEDSSYAKMLSKAMGEINWNQPAVSIERLIRGLNSWPSAFSHLRGKTMKIWKARVVKPENNIKQEDSIVPENEINPEKAAPGEVIRVSREGITVATKEDALELLEIQPEGKKRMAVKEYLLGYKVEVGEQFL